MKVRRVVTGRDHSGKSVFLLDGPAPATLDYAHIPGMSNTRVWGTPPFPALDRAIQEPAAKPTTALPEPGGTQLMIVRFPPDTVMHGPDFDPVAAAEENRNWLPGFAERFEPAAPGMHTTDSIDYGFVLAGEIWLELDDGQMRHLREHDIVIQNGTRHAWRNKADREAVMAFVLIGARR